MRSERLFFREFRDNDFELLYSVFSNEEIMEYALMDKVNSEKEFTPYFDKILKNNSTIENRSLFEYAVFSNSSREFIGFADIEIISKNLHGGNAEIGYFLLPQFWGNGYATEIAKTLIECCFKDFNLHRVFARCNANNSKSEKVMKNCGMEREAEFRKVRYKFCRWENELQYSILKDDWINQ
ncbi:GNAT family N-acetyltransferase [Paenibacillus turpanensis]|uniref:GNAT family N-acetyltransferase n=1 Tax=Paenibacillus turpanensis TaxID=2689078 RepID=UPI00140DF02F|nr:GNAT family protein [Paenibacillus turpanensis]